jgi:hypothetical protein
MEQVLTIILNEAGELGVNGPIDNKMLSYGMLEVAKEAIAEHHRGKQRLVQPVMGMTLPKLD